MYLDIKFIHERLNSFDKNIKFTIDKFPDGNVCFLDIQIDYINYKQTHTTGQYTHFHSQTPWPLKQQQQKLYSIELKECVLPMLHSMNKLKTNLCPGIHTLNK